MAYTSIRFTNTSDELVARGSHTKYVLMCKSRTVAKSYVRYVAMAWKDPQNITDELKPEKS